MKMTVIFQNEREVQLSMKDAMHNGIMLENELVFLGPDPQLYFNWKETLPVKKILIEADIVDHITAERAEHIYRKMRKNNIFKRVARKIFR